MTKCLLWSNNTKHCNKAQWPWEDWRTHTHRRKWRENRVCEVRVHQHDLDRLLARSRTSLGWEGQRIGTETGKARAAQGSRKLHDSCLSWLLSFRWFSSTTFRLIPFAKLSWQSPWMRLGGKISGTFWSCPGLVFLCSFLALGLCGRNWLSGGCCGTEPNVKQNTGKPKLRSLLNVGGGSAVGRRVRGFLRALWNQALVEVYHCTPPYQHPWQLCKTKGPVSFMLWSTSGHYIKCWVPPRAIFLFSGRHEGIPFLKLWHHPPLLISLQFYPAPPPSSPTVCHVCPSS